MCEEIAKFPENKKNNTYDERINIKKEKTDEI